MNPVLNSRRFFYIVFFSVILLFFVVNIQYVKSSEINSSLEVNREFEMIEYSVLSGTYSNINDINLELPSSTWIIDDIEFNFTDVEFGLEIKIIEDNPTDTVSIEKFGDNYGYAVQIIIDEPTIIYSVFIYGNNESTENKPLYVQIRGYDNITNSPNSTVYGTPILLNMSYSLNPSWHLQNFLNPIYLPKGNYYLVIDGASIGESPKSTYNWYYNNTSPNYPELYISEYDGTSWAAGVQGTPFLHKFIQKLNSSFFPEEINMTAEFNGTSFQISDGDHPGKGYLKKSDINFHPNNENFKIKIKNNKTKGLEFSLSYSININNELLAASILEIRYNSSNIWSIFPSIERFSDNHTVKFNYPDSWNNILVSKNQQDVTSEVIIDSLYKVIIIPNEIIENGAEWVIQASSPNIAFNIETVRTNYTGEQELEFSIKSPILNGMYDFKLVSRLGNLRFNETGDLLSGENLFSYPIDDSWEGNYTAYIFLYNQTDAGVQSQIFSITQLRNSSKNFPIEWVLVIILIGGSVIGGSSYVTMIGIKKLQTRRADKLRLFLERCSDVMNLEYIIVLDKKSGIDVYSESFGEKQVDATLISGFLQAIQNFGSEVLERAKESRTVKVEYQKYIIIMTEFVNLRLIIIMKESPSKNFIYAIESLAYDIYKDFGNLFDKFDGALAEFQGIKKLLEEHLNISILYPLTINYTHKMKIAPEEKQMVQRAITFMHENNFDYFYVIYLLPDNVCTPKDFEIILQLIQKGIFVPIEKDTD